MAKMSISKKNFSQLLNILNNQLNLENDAFKKADYYLTLLMLIETQVLIQCKRTAFIMH